MPNIAPLITENGPITMLQRLHDGRIGVVTDSNGVYLLRPETGAIENHMKIEELRPLEHSTAFSGDGSYFAFAHTTARGNAVRIIDLASKELRRSYATQENPVELLAFDDTGTYIVAGTTTGRVFLWRTDGNNLLARLSSFPEYTPHLLTLPKQNYVSAAAFGKNAVATTGYGGSVVVTNVHTQANTKRLKPGKARIDALFFLDERRIVAGNEDGVIIVMHTEELHPTRRIGTGIGPIKHLLLLPNRHFLLAASEFNHIALINLETMEVLNNRYVTTPSPIRSMTAHTDHSVIVGMADGMIADVDLSPFSDFNRLLEAEKYVDAYILCDQEPFIKESAEFQRLEAKFEEAYDRAHRLLALERREDAHHVLLPFMKIGSKGKEIRALFSAFDHYPRLNHLVAEKKYSVAYGLCAQYPPLKRTAPYLAMEKEWEEAFSKAQKLVLTGRERQARQTFEHFLTVGEKSAYIRMLLQNKAIVFAFAKALSSKDFVALKRVTEQEPILRNTPSYKSVMESAATIIEAIMGAIKSGQFDKADLLCDELLRIPHLSHHHESVSRFIDKAKKLFRLHKEKRFFELYRFLDTTTELSVLPLAKKAEERWNKKIQECEEAALKGNTAAIKEILGDLITLPTRNEKIGNLLRASYQMQIKHLLAKENPDRAGRAIERYIDIFGIDNETRLLIKLLNTKGDDLFLSDEQQVNRARGLWLAMTEGKLPDTLSD